MRVGSGVDVRRRRGQRRDVGTDEHQFAVLDDDVGFLEVCASCADGLHLPAGKRESGLDPLLDEIIVECLPVFDDAHVLRLQPA